MDSSSFVSLLGPFSLNFDYFICLFAGSRDGSKNL